MSFWESVTQQWCWSSAPKKWVAILAVEIMSVPQSLTVALVKVKQQNSTSKWRVSYICASTPINKKNCLALPNAEFQQRLPKRFAVHVLQKCKNFPCTQWCWWLSSFLQHQFRRIFHKEKSNISYTFSNNNFEWFLYHLTAINSFRATPIGNC